MSSEAQGEVGSVKNRAYRFSLMYLPLLTFPLTAHQYSQNMYQNAEMKVLTDEVAKEGLTVHNVLGDGQFRVRRRIYQLIHLGNCAYRYANDRDASNHPDRWLCGCTGLTKPILC
jgi:hypothetical protein